MTGRVEQSVIDEAPAKGSEQLVETTGGGGEGWTIDDGEHETTAVV